MQSFPSCSAGDATPLMQTSNAELQAAGEEAAGVNANDPPKAPVPELQPLFSLIRGEVEQMDSRALPLFLHQVRPQPLLSVSLTLLPASGVIEIRFSMIDPSLPLLTLNA